MKTTPSKRMLVSLLLCAALTACGDGSGISAANHALRNSIYDQTQSEANLAQGKQGSNFQVAGNIKAPKRDGPVHFSNVTAEDFRLTPTSSALDSGADVTPYNLTVAMGLDHSNQVVQSLPRFLGSRIDVGAFEADYLSWVPSNGAHSGAAGSGTPGRPTTIH